MQILWKLKYIVFNVSQSECEHELQEELGTVQQMAVRDSYDDQMAKVRLKKCYLMTN